MPLVYIIILNYNHLEDLEQTIESFLKQNYSRIKIVISDNGSTDGSIEYIKKEYPEIKIIANDTNLGWAGGNNIGIEYAINNGADYILLANNDLYFDNPKIISELVKDMISDNSIGLIGPIQNYFYEREKIYSAGWNFIGRNGRIFNHNRIQKIGLKDNLKVVDSVSGAFMLFRRSLIVNIGFIDEKFFLYVEDADLAIRAWHSGYICAIRTDLTIYHKISATSGESPLKLYYKTRNLPYMIFKNKHDFKPFILFFLAIIYSNFKLFPKILFYSKYKNSRIEFSRSFFYGWYHFFIKKMGKVY